MANINIESKTVILWSFDKMSINIFKNSGDLLLVTTKPNSLPKTSIKVKDWNIISNVRTRSLHTKKKVNQYVICTQIETGINSKPVKSNKITFVIFLKLTLVNLKF